MNIRERASAGQAQGGESRWWRSSPLFSLEQGHARPKAGGVFAYEVFWKPKAFVAWIYEVVRGLPYFKAIGREIAAQDLQVLRGLPPFPELNHKQQSSLVQAFTKRPAFRVMRIRRSSPWPGYTAPLPPLSFDRAVFSRSAILDFVGKYLDEQDGGVEVTSRKGNKSRNRDQKYKLGDWRTVELVRPRRSNTAAFSRYEQKVRSGAKKLGLKYYKQVLVGYLFAQTNLLLPTVTPLLRGLVERRFSERQVKCVVAEVFAKRSEMKKS